MKIGSKGRFGLTATLALGLIVGGGVLPAQAYGNGSDIGGLCGGGWAWSSMFSGDYSHSNTTKSGNWCTIGASVRIYYNEYNRVNSSSDYVSTSRYGGASGGYHYNGSGVKSS